MALCGSSARGRTRSSTSLPSPCMPPEVDGGGPGDQADSIPQRRRKIHMSEQRRCTTSRWRSGIVVGLVAGGVVALSPILLSPVHAAGIVVDTTQQGLGIPGCSLEEAILAANY